MRLRVAHAIFVGAFGGTFQIAEGHVIPRTHHVTVVDGDRYLRRMRKNKTYRRRARKIEFVDDGHEVVAVGAQAVHPDHSRRRVGAGFEFDGF